MIDSWRNFFTLFDMTWLLFIFLCQLCNLSNCITTLVWFSLSIIRLGVIPFLRTSKIINIASVIFKDFKFTTSWLFFVILCCFLLFSSIVYSLLIQQINIKFFSLLTPMLVIFRIEHSLLLSFLNSYTHVTPFKMSPCYWTDVSVFVDCWTKDYSFIKNACYIGHFNSILFYEFT